MRPNISNCHALPGLLYIFDGPDGSGKTTQIAILEKMLKKQGKKVTISAWKSSPIIGEFLKQNETMKKADERVLAETNLFLQAADMLYRIETEVIPAMKQGHIVILDRGICTLIVRGMLIGMPEASIRTGLLWWRNSIYRELFDKAINISVTIGLAESLKRLQKRSKKQLQTPERAEGTLLTLHFINTLVYAPDGKKLTRNDRKQFISDAQAKIIDTYIHIYEAEQNVIHIDGGMSKKEIAKDIERQIVDSM